MDKATFKRLKSIANNEKVIFLGDTESNKEQRDYDSFIDRELKFLLAGGFIKAVTRNIYTVTEYGSRVSLFNSWDKYLEHLEENHRREVETNIFINTLSKWQVKIFWWLFAFSILGLGYSIIDLILNLTIRNQEL